MDQYDLELLYLNIKNISKSFRKTKMQLYYVYLTMEHPSCGSYGKGNITVIAQIILHFL